MQVRQHTQPQLKLQAASRVGVSRPRTVNRHLPSVIWRIDGQFYRGVILPNDRHWTKVKELAAEVTFPLSSEQRDYLCRGHTGFGTVAACSTVSGPVDIRALTKAANYVVARHEPVRMRLRERNGELRQSFVAPGASEVTWERVLLTTDGDVGAHATEELDRAITGPIKLKFLQRADGDVSYVMALLDHLACDGWSSYLFLQEMWTAYRAVACHAVPQLAPVKLPYSQYVLAQQDAAAARSDRVTAYWADRVAGFAKSATGLRRLGPPEVGRGRADLHVTIPGPYVRQARQLAVAIGLTPNVIPLGCVLLALWSLSDGESAGLSFIYAGREDPRSRFLLGLFRRYVTVVTDRVPENRLDDFFRDLSRTVVQAMWWSRPPHRASEFEAAVAAQRSSPLADVLYNQVDTMFGQNRADKVLDIGPQTAAGVAEEPHFSPARWRAFSEPRLRLVLRGGSCPVLQAIFNDGCVAEPEVRQFLGRIAALLAVMSPSRADQPVRDVVRAALGRE